MHSHAALADTFDFFVSSLPGVPDAATPVAAARTGAIGLMNLCGAQHIAPATKLIESLVTLAPNRCGLILDAPLQNFELAALNQATHWNSIFLTSDAGASLREAISVCKSRAERVGVIVTDVTEAQHAVEAGADLLIAKGHEAGGFVGEETTFILIQRLTNAFRTPIVGWGGIGLNTAAACRVAGCAGVILDWQLALMQESPLPLKFRRRLTNVDGSETYALPFGAGRYVRFFSQPGFTAKERLEAAAGAAEENQQSSKDACRQLIEDAVGSADPSKAVWLTGQDIGFAPAWAARHSSVGRAIRQLRDAMDKQVASAAESQSFSENSALAKSHGTQFPLVQGPMTRVSDVPEFCEAIGAAGGLPFLALALMGEQQVRQLLKETSARMDGRPWGVGVLGFVPQEIRAQQWPVIEEYCPPYAVIAGGRPDQAASLEARGIATYLHVPSPGMLEMFIRDGARRFIFEGRECGGHVGPRTSFVLWETMVRVLASADLAPEECAKVHVLFAGGIHDGLGAAMVATLAQPLVDRGMKIGGLMGTAYLFTNEAVSSGAIVPAFQSICISTSSSVIVESGPGHAIRCADTDFVRMFEEEKRRLVQEKMPHEELRTHLEHLNLGRLRIAAKGLTRSSTAEVGLLQLDEAEQRSQGMYMLGQVASLREQTCSIRDLHDSVCLGASAQLDKFGSSAAAPARNAKPPRPLDLAIVGMSCLVPGADTPQKLWRNVLAKHDPITLIPADRFDHTEWYDANRTARDKIYSKWGGFIPDIAFDPLKYGIPPASLKSIEPMQLLALELVSRVLHDGGYDEVNPYRERTSVILGVGGGSGELGASYSFRAMAPRYLKNPDETIWSQLPEWTEDSFAGILLNVVAGRISNRFDLGGINCTVDAACASSLAAVYAGAHELSSGNSDLVIVGGCDTIQNSMGYLCFATAGALSPTGRARVFDASADGIVISEGHGAILLKRLDDAERDGDKVYAVLRGIAAGSDGRSKGLSAPRLEGQTRTLRRAYESTGIDPKRIGLFEAHGTGTAVGDQTECLALNSFLAESGAPRASAAIGSVKSSIGHTKCAAGIVGVIKATLALHHRVLPPTMHVDRPNQKAGFGSGPLYVNSETRPWLQIEGPRRAGVSSFGFGGTNFHAILEEYPAATSTAGVTAGNRAAELFAFSGESLPSLLAAVTAFLGQLTAALESRETIPLHGLAYAQHLKHGGLNGKLRLAVVAEDAAVLRDQLQRFIAACGNGAPLQKLPLGIHFTSEPLGPAAPIAILFPGQGSQAPNMLRDLAVEFSDVSTRFEEAERVLAPILGESVANVVFPPPSFSDAERDAEAERLKATRFAQPALGICDIAVWRLLHEFGVNAAFFAGHSYGELAALCAAESISEANLYALSAARGLAMTSSDTEAGQMLAVTADAETVRRHLAGLQEVWLANLNSPRQTVITGTVTGIAAAEHRLTEANLSVRRLPVAAAFHSPLMRTARKRFDLALSQTEFGAPRASVYSNVTADKYPSDGLSIAGLLGSQLEHEVRFAEEIERMYADGARIFIEAGPKSVLTSLVREILGDRSHIALATQPSGTNGVAAFLNSLAELVAQGVFIDLDQLYEGRTIEPFNMSKSAASANQHSPHVWLVNGAYCRPASQPPRVPTPMAALASSKHSPATDGDTHHAIPATIRTNHTALNTEQRNATPLGASQASRLSPEAISPIEAPHTNGAGNLEFSTPDVEEHHSSRDNGQPHSLRPDHRARQASTGEGAMDLEAYAHFQETMRQFLETQERVMRYQFGEIAQPAHDDKTRTSSERKHLSHDTTQEHKTSPTSENGHTARALPSVANRVAQVEPGLPHQTHETNGHRLAEKNGHSPIAQPVQLAVAPLVAMQPTAATQIQPTISRDETLQNWLKSLLKIVEDRTGYPIDMLDPDANLEADLGIDSIKRVEIVAAFRRAELESLSELAAGTMERLTGARTMRAVVETAAELLADERPAKVVETAAQPSCPPVQAKLSVETCIDQLVRLVADRTGYPVEMLDPNARLEAELGIDSIKRVEIIAAFRRDALQDAGNLPADLMERLAAAQSIRSIAEAAVSLIDGPLENSAAAPASPTTAAALAAVESTPAPNADVLLASLMQIVSDRTGYPEEMLDADAKLEADLGIDSIKRVEIIATFQREILSPAQKSSCLVEQLTAARTIREIVALVCGTQPVEAQNSVKPQANNQPHPSKNTIAKTILRTTVADECPRCSAVCVETPIGSQIRVLTTGVVLITGDAGGVGSDLVAEFSACGRPVCCISSIQLSDPTAITKAVDAARRQHGRVAAVIHLAPLSPAPNFPGISTSEWQARQDTELKGLLYLLQAIEPELSAAEPAVHVSAFTIGGGDFDSNVNANEAVCPWRGGIAGLLKVAAKENPSHIFRVVDVDELPEPSLVLREVTADGPVEIGYRARRRLAIAVRPMEIAASHSNARPPISADSIVVVTGGGRGITAQVVEEIAAHVPATFILVGRSELLTEHESAETASVRTDSELRSAIIRQKKSLGEESTIAAVERELSKLKNSREIRATLANLAAAGARAEYVPCDIRNLAAVEALVAEIECRYGEVDALVHGAGVLRDQVIKDKTSEAFDDVVATKVDSFLNLVEAIGPEKLKLAVLFSSVSGFFGNTGQCDYAAANEILNRCARRLQSTTFAKVVALNWGPWADVGMVSPEVAKKMRANGVQLITPTAGRRAAWREVANERTEGVRAILGAGPWIQQEVIPSSDSHEQTFQGVAPPLLAGQHVKLEPDGSVTARILLSPDRQPFLVDHQIDGKAVLPLAMAVELMAETASIAERDQHLVEVADIRMLSGIVLDQTSKEVVARAELVRRDAISSEWTVQLLATDSKRRFYQSIVRFSAARPTPPPLPSVPAIEQPALVSASQAYNEYLFHGPAFQAIEELSRVDETGIDAVAVPSDAAACMQRAVGPWLIDAVILDAAAQLALVWSNLIHETVMLPTRAARYRSFGDLGRGPIELRLRTHNGAEQNAYRADIWIIRGDVVLGHIEGLEGAGSAQLNRITAGKIR